MTASLLSVLAPPAVADWIYIFKKGYLYANQGLASESVRYAVSVQLSRTGEPFDVEVEGRRETASGFVVWPGTWRRVHAENVSLVSIGLSAANRWFRTISTLKPTRALLPLSRADFMDCDDAIDAAFHGQLSASGAQALSNAVMKRIAADLPEPRPLDARIQRVISRVEEDCSVSMGELAADVHLSYHGLSRAFSDSMGVALRNYLLARKLDVAFAMASQGMNLTEIAVAAGFSDLPHFSRIWMRAGGAPPSHFLNNRNIHIRSWFAGQ